MPRRRIPSIQDAVNAASPGNLTRICPGTYREQLSISKSVRFDVDNGAVLLPNNLVANTFGPTGNPIAAAVLVRESPLVDLGSLLVDTVNNGITECSPELMGIPYQNSSGSMDHPTVRNTKLSTSLNGCQSGEAIMVQSLSGGTSKVRIDHASVHDYQKNGITAKESGTEVTQFQFQLESFSAFVVPHAESFRIRKLNSRLSLLLTLVLTSSRSHLRCEATSWQKACTHPTRNRP